MDIGRPTNKTEVQVIIGVVYYSEYMCPMQYYVLNLLVEAVIVTKGRRIILNDPIEYSFIEIKCVILYETSLNYTHFNIPFTFNNDASDKNLVILSDIIINPLMSSLEYL